MGMLKEKRIEQRMNDKKIEWMQAGFTEGRCLEENLFILAYCIEEYMKVKEMLVVVAVDFRKAFDNVDRVALIESLKYCKCDPRIISVVASLYKGDMTIVEREGMRVGEVEVWSGIRQGCTGSPQLFIMVVSRIIERILRSGLGYRLGWMYLPVLFYADDSLMLARSVEEAERMIELMVQTVRSCGMEVNKEKSVCMVLNGCVNEGNTIGGIRVVNEMKYLGVKVVKLKGLFW